MVHHVNVAAGGGGTYYKYTHYTQIVLQSWNIPSSSALQTVVFQSYRRAELCYWIILYN